MTLPFWFIVLGAALATYFTRIGGYLLVSSFSTIPPRLEAALNAVPAAVLSALVAPAFVYQGLDVTITMVLAGLVGLRAKTLTMLAFGWVLIVALRHFAF